MEHPFEGVVRIIGDNTCIYFQHYKGGMDYSIVLIFFVITTGALSLLEDEYAGSKDTYEETSPGLDLFDIPKGGTKKDWTVQPVKIIIRDKPEVVNVPHPYPVKQFAPVPKLVPVLKKVPVLKPLPVPFFVPKIKPIPKKVLVP
ncbi:hypothetical protein X975_21547, partial [Stegodyphus mimosarum]